jgi:hypothetical protein
MKKILLLFTALFIISSCTLEPDDEQKYGVEFLPVDWVIYPEYVTVGNTYEVRAGYTKPNGCYLFDRFYSEQDGSAVLIAVQTMVRTDGECKNYETDSHDEQTFTFSCDEAYTASSYIFKFYTGLDVQGNKTYTQIEIPVK